MMHHPTTLGSVAHMTVVFLPNFSTIGPATKAPAAPPRQITDPYLLFNKKVQISDR